MTNQPTHTRQCHHCGATGVALDSFNYGEPVCEECHNRNDCPFGEAATIEAAAADEAAEDARITAEQAAGY